ncbi:MAG: dipeptidase [Planctomycetes bacterium]|nr:dipeptidase [Planctomycetota bacterium]
MTKKDKTNVHTGEVTPRSLAPVTPGPIELTAEAMRIHRAGLLIDGHNDLPWKIREKGGSSFDTLDISRRQEDLHTDIPGLRAGGVGAQFWAAYVPPEKIRTGGALRYALEQIDLIHRMVRRYPEDLSMAYSADDIERVHAQGRIASLIGVEGGHAIENSLGALRMLHALGTRYLTLTHADTLDWVDAATDQPRHGGLTEFGEQVVLEMNRLGMMVDISHVSADSMRHVLRVSRTPLIASHSSADAVAHHPRNVPDDVLRAVAQGGGVVMVNFCAGFIHPEGAKITQRVFDVMREARAKYPDDADYERAGEKWRKENPIPLTTVHTLVDHIDHIVKIAGIDHVGIGSDFDGVTELPAQLEDVSGYPYITQELLNRGYSTENIHKVMGGNLLRTFRRVESLAGK